MNYFRIVPTINKRVDSTMTYESMTLINKLRKRSFVKKRFRQQGDVRIIEGFRCRLSVLNGSGHFTLFPMDEGGECVCYYPNRALDFH